MAIDLFNTLSGTVEPLAPERDNELRMYCCGPTVYDYGHIGNFRTFLHVDVLRRVARLQGMKLKHVMNITDVDDKIIRNAATAGMSISDYTAKFERAFFEDMEALGVERPEIVPHATESIPDMVSLIQTLAKEDIAYRAEDGSWYFRIAKFPDYGKLSKKDFEGIEDGARVDVDEYEKDSARDFALWKAEKNGEASWQTELGTGRPGWHIECSAMAMKHLGATFDLHAGGEDLMFPHHENEIAQSECATHKPFARHWFHVRFLLVEGKKMSKSEGNFFTLRDLLLKGYRASAIRFLLLSVPYRHQMNFTFEGLTESANAIDRLRTFRKRLKEGVFNATIIDTEVQERAAEAKSLFIDALKNDLNTAEARAAAFDLIRYANTRLDERAKGGRPLGAQDRDALINFIEEYFDKIFDIFTDRDHAITKLALEWAEKEGRIGEVAEGLVESAGLSDEDIQKLVDDRTLAKKQRNFAKADAIRNELMEKGALIEDSKDGVRWKRK